MLESIFGFKGRIGRVRYLLSCFALGAVTIFLFVALLFAFGFHPSDKHALVKPLILAALIIVPLWFWTGLSLQACRIRDIGLQPAPVILGWFGLNFVLRLAEAALWHPHAGAVLTADPLAFPILVVNGSLALALLVWPSRRDDDEPGLGGGTDSHPQVPKAAARTPSLQPRGEAATFGRRGL